MPPLLPLSPWTGAVLDAPPGDVILSVLIEFWLTDATEAVPGESSPGPSASRATSPNGLLPAAASAANATAFDLTGSMSLQQGNTYVAGPLATAAAVSSSPAAAAPHGASQPLRSYSYQPLAEELVQALTVLIKYGYVRDPQAADRKPEPAQASNPWLSTSPVQVSRGRCDVPSITSSVCAVVVV